MTIVQQANGALAVENRPDRYAGFVSRTIALAIDAALIDLAALVVAGIVTLVFSLFPVSSDVHDVAVVAGGVLFVLWTIAYFVAFWTTTGETPGNRAMRLRVARSDGSRLRPRQALVRIAGMVISLPLLWGYLPILVNDRRRGVHDALAGTVVLVTADDVDVGVAGPSDGLRRRVINGHIRRPALDAVHGPSDREQPYAVEDE